MMNGRLIATTHTNDRGGWLDVVTNIQIAIADIDYARKVSDLLADGDHRVHIVDTPAIVVDGVILLDEPRLNALALDPKDAERCVVLEPGLPLHTADLWRAGVRYLAFTSDPISVTKMAVLAAELRLMTPKWVRLGAYH